MADKNLACLRPWHRGFERCRVGGYGPTAQLPSTRVQHATCPHCGGCYSCPELIEYRLKLLQGDEPN